jgi:hypothetical protein
MRLENAKAILFLLFAFQVTACSAQFQSVLRKWFGNAINLGLIP